MRVLATALACQKGDVEANLAAHMELLAAAGQAACELVVDSTWDATVRGGADVVLFCSAPGLYGRRTNDAEWRAGFEWWEGCGLADAVRHARRLGVWMVMATQAGSTVDEDFPGIAALVSPAGLVMDRLPDWQPGTLLIDIQ